MVQTRSSAKSRSRSSSIEIIDADVLPKTPSNRRLPKAKSTTPARRFIRLSAISPEPEVPSSSDDRLLTISKPQKSKGLNEKVSTPLRRSRRLASEEPEEIPPESLPPELARKGRQTPKSSAVSRSGNVEDVSVTKTREPDFSQRITHRVVASPSVEVIEEAVEEAAKSPKNDVIISEDGIEVNDPKVTSDVNPSIGHVADNEKASCSGQNLLDTVVAEEKSRSEEVPTHKEVLNDAVVFENEEACINQDFPDIAAKTDPEKPVIGSDIAVSTPKKGNKAETTSDSQANELADVKAVSQLSSEGVHEKESSKRRMDKKHSDDEGLTLYSTRNKKISPSKALSRKMEKEPAKTVSSKESSSIVLKETSNDLVETNEDSQDKSIGIEDPDFLTRITTVDEENMKGRKTRKDNVLYAESVSPVSSTINSKPPVVESVVEPFPDLDENILIQQRKDCNDASFLFDRISKGYSLLTSSCSAAADDANPLITLNEEVVWQQLAMHNKKLKKKFRKTKVLLDIPIIVKCREKKEDMDPKKNAVIKFEDEDEETISSEVGGIDEMDEEASNSSLFGLDKKDFEVELNELDDDKSDVAEMEKTDEFEVLKKEKKLRKTVVDDRFFSLAEMEEFLDQEEKKDSIDGIFEQLPDDGNEDEAVDYHYAEFYGEDDYIQKKEAEENDRKRKKTKRRSSQNETEETPATKKKKVHFLESDLDEENVEENQNDSNVESESRVLLGTVDNDDKEESQFQKRQKMFKNKIALLEEENLAPRSWELSGEVTAMDRKKNSMLEKHIDYDRQKKIAPVITIDKTEKLEAMIIQRIKDKAFDDVERKVRGPESNREYRAFVEEKIIKKSLAEVYEEQYQKAQRPELVEEKRDEKKVEIEKRISALFKKLDALFHYKGNPPEIRPEVQIVSNIASLRKEEVGPLASTEEMLIAPEEVKRHEKGEVKGKEERTAADKARERRKKKNLQRLLNRAKRREESEVVAKEKDRNFEKKRLVKEKGNVKSTKFFKQLQEATVTEIKSKSAKIKESKKTYEGKINASAKYLL